GSRVFSLSDRRYYTEALRTGTFAVGEPVRARPDTTRWMLGYGLPVRDPAGRIVAVVHASYPLDSASYVAEVGTLPPGSIVTIVDDDGRIVFRSLDDSAV